MSPEEWESIERIFNEALDVDSAERAAYIATACGGNMTLQREVESLLQARATEFLEQPATELAARAIARSHSAIRRRLQPGARLGPYEIAGTLGKGGMGEVYRAVDTRLPRSVAVKVLFEAIAGDPQRRERFEREANAISRLNHPHICTLHDVGEQDGIHYLVMELVEGETLASRLKKGRLSSNEILEYFVQIAAALDEAHRHGVIHRDLKPENIMITRSGIKLLDFGVAKLKGNNLETSGASRISTEAAPLTAEGTIVGTLQYMAPEQLQGKDSDARSDIFAFGAVAYESITGKKAFEGKTQVSLIAAILAQEPPSMEGHEPPGSPLNDIVSRCLAKNPEDRWQTAGDLLRNLRQLSPTSARLRTTPRSTRLDRRGLLLSTGALLPVAAIVARAHFAGDPWIAGYAISLLFVTAFLSLILILFQGHNQKHIAFTGFFIVAALVSGAVWWRHIDLQHFLSDPANVRRPLGFCYGHYGFIPYLCLVGSGLIFMTYVMYSNTRDEINKRNQRPILVAFGILIVYLFGCRLVWEKIESDGLAQLQRHPSIELNCPQG